MRALFHFALLLAAPAAAQEPIPDTTAPWRYFPLEIGNVWEYHITGFPWEPARDEHREIVGDTVVADTAYVVQVRAWWSAAGGWEEQARVLLRFDTLSTRVMRRAAGREWPEACNLGAPFGAAVDCHPYPGADGQPEDEDVVGAYGGTVVVQGQAVPVEAKKRFVSRVQAWPNVFPEYAAPIGYVRGYEAFCGTCEEELLYARVGGVEYGTPVSSEPGPRLGDAGLDVRPNPVRTRAAVTLTLAAPAAVTVRAFDVLGRPVATLAEGRRAAGTHDLTLDARSLPAGVYLVRAEAGRSVTTRRVVVLGR